MSTIRTRLAPHLPYLRRYARALTGTQKSGDAWVRATLEALLADPQALDETAPPRLELYRLFHAFWGPHTRGEPQARSPALSTGLSLGEASLSAIPVAEREALLLTALEGFAVVEAAQILGRPVPQVEEELSRARAAIAAAMRSRVLIIEDEPLIAMHLESIVSEMGHDVVAVAATHGQAVEAAGTVKPDLVLADVQLADGSSGIEAVAEILESMRVPVVFITAYPERLLTGERPEPAWLVTKPFERETVVATVGQALLLATREPLPA
jgi:DNA-directed RNA polymerase specialized sigma24 family protein